LKEQSKKEDISDKRATINLKSDRYLYDRFCKDFSEAQKNLKLGDERFLETISCPVMVNLFLDLGFVKEKPSQEEQVALASIWSLIGGDEKGQQKVNLINVKIVMCCIQNFHTDWFIDMYRGDVLDKLKLGRHELKQMYFTSSEISFIAKKYVQLYQNR
jgi:hypothetical protein